YVTLNRPERMNALDNHSHGELIEIFDDYSADPDIWAAIVTGAGERVFCAGNDLKATAQASANGERRVDPSSRFAAITRGYSCPKPLIAAVNASPRAAASRSRSRATSWSQRTRRASVSRSHASA